jgi:type I restriction enzyme S subunit
LKDEQPGVYTEEVHPKGYLIQPGDLLVGMDGEFRSYIWGGTPAWLNQRVCCFSPKHEISVLYLRYTLDPQLSFIEATEVATTVIHLGKNDIDGFKALLPASEIQHHFSRMAEPILQKLLINKANLNSLSHTRDTLLPKLISGELRVKDAERFVGVTCSSITDHIA